jgi:hypothetical protein
MNRYYYLLLTILLISTQYKVFAKKVNQQTAALAAKNFYYERINQKRQTDYYSIKILSTIEKKQNSETDLYIFNIKNGGYVIVSADDAAIPIVAYSFSGNIDMENPPPAFKEWLNGYAAQIEEIRTLKLNSPAKTDSLWKALTTTNPSTLKIFSGKSVDPLLISTWDQNRGYNKLCPVDSAGPGGHVYAGCVAVAMAQIMYYYKYPAQGFGTHSYYHQKYGSLTANFGNTQYKWHEMVNKMPNEGNHEVAQLLYHCGVSVNMNYSPNGSGAWPNRCVTAYKSYFKYSNQVYIDDKVSYTNNQWIWKITQNLNDKIPLFYHGYPSTGGGLGHAFNLDGYQGSDHFHFNWGWSGHYNGYFYLSSLNPGNHDYSAGQGAIFNIKPPSTKYPSYCQSTTTITSTNGVIFDGSGPKSYNNNSDCYWLIKPSVLIDRLILKFDRFALETNDYVTVYDGSTVSSPVLGTFTGQTLPSTITSTGKTLLVKFKTNGSGTDEGFDASFKSIMPVYCQGTVTLTGATGVFSDGSGNQDYNNRTVCRWMIDGQGNQGIKLNFSKFKTEQGKDWVKIYDPTQVPSKLLAAYSGHQIPPSVSATHGKMLVMFATSASNTDEGWEARYYTGSVGMEEQTNAATFIYPNPANSVINIDLQQQQGKAVTEFYSIDGKLIKTVIIDAGKTSTVDISTLEKGLYIIIIRSNGNIIRKRIEIIH